MICVNAWRHQSFGKRTGSVTRDCICQSCGAKVTLPDPLHQLGTAIAAIVLTLSIFGWVIPWAKWSRGRRAWRRHPLVEGAPMPSIKFRAGPGDRRCGACGGVAVLTSVTRNRHNGIPTGTDYVHTCRQCGKAIKTESAGGHVMMLSCAAVVGLIAYACRPSAGGSSWWTIVLGAAAAGVFLASALSIARAIQNPLQ
jgi:hypothetical protein